jgi:hypothetical protein
VFMSLLEIVRDRPARGTRSSAPPHCAGCSLPAMLRFSDQVLGPGLDGGAGLHYRKKMALMSRRTTVLSKADVPPLQLGKAGVSPWRVGLCLLLGLFFLYNPFFTICVASGPSAVVHHPVSYRSTIASSELGCGTVQLTKVQAAPLEAFVAIEKALLLQADDSRPKPEGETVRAVTQDFASSLWFRPPPIL